MTEKVLDFAGGDKMRKVLSGIAARLGIGGDVKIGFLEGATYPANAREALKRGSHSKRQKARLEQVASSGSVLGVPEVAFWNEFGTSRAPPRPFFRQMIAAKSPNWGENLATAAKATGYDSGKALGLMGENIKDDLVASIVAFSSPGLSEYTKRKKGFDKPLIDSGVMQRAVDWVVTK